ncbi:uncharacterized protein F5Z01DRAFT_351493 [Emericellopsis atlantica]|uniref:Uncharacterized protein n=1 Tax=Emericellopsis atlantica TaxID=2614577 RepID=A0A9P7ZFB0_9HYPO|nr:uncharacterized protein F5Z01DRAFT_351493 [Emericellopsis atlantica]KAG9250641.1 hypothetical protein F5Z01DRAFT_351493 [Emericellopsis atlantica]
MQSDLTFLVTNLMGSAIVSLILFLIAIVGLCQMRRQSHESITGHGLHSVASILSLSFAILGLGAVLTSIVIFRKALPEARSHTNETFSSLAGWSIAAVYTSTLYGCVHKQLRNYREVIVAPRFLCYFSRRYTVHTRVRRLARCRRTLGSASDRANADRTTDYRLCTGDRRLSEAPDLAEGSFKTGCCLRYMDHPRLLGNLPFCHSIRAIAL